MSPATIRSGPVQRRSRQAWPRTLAALLAGTVVASGAGAVAAPAVRRLTDQPWQVTTFTEDAGLGGRYVFDLAFEPDGAVWVAASGGLRHYDGYRWEHFGTDAGLPSSFVRSVLRTRDGTLWVGTDQGAGVLDPRQGTFDRRGSERGLAGPSVRRMFEDPDGTVWFCSDRWPEVAGTGGLTSWKDGVWTRHGMAEGLPSQDVMEYLRDSRGRQFVATTRGMVERQGAGWGPVSELGLPQETMFWALVEGSDGAVLAQANDAPRSIYALHEGRWGVVGTNALALFATETGEVYVTDSARQGNVYRLLRWEDGVLVPIATTESRPNFASIQQARLAPDGAAWLAGRGCLARWQVDGGEWAGYEGLPRPRLLDRQGNVWFADDQGVIIWSGSGFATVPGAHGAVWADGTDGVWTRTDAGLAWIAGSRRTVYPESVTGMRQVERGVPDARGGIWVHGRDADGRCVVARFDGERWSRVPLGDLANQEVRAAEADLREGIWLIFRDRGGRSYELGRAREDRLELEAFAGGKPPLSNPGLGIDRHGLWLYGFAGLYHLPADQSTGWRRVDELASRGFESHASSGDASIFLFLEDDSGQPGVALYRQGRWEQRPVVLRAPSVVRHEALDGSVLFGDQGGFSILRPEQAEEPGFVPLPVDATVTALVRDREGNVWLGTTAGVLRFQPGDDPPRTELRTSTAEMRREGTLHFEFRAVKRWTPASARSVAQFSWRVDGGPWSRFNRATTAAVHGKDLTPGTHRFEVRARDAAGHTDARGAAFAFRVFPTPLEQRPWFRLTMGGIAVLVGLLAAIAFGRARQTAAANAALRLEVGRRQEAEAGLQQAHGLLEQRVEQRTQQLSRANTLLLREISERKQALQALEESEVRFRSIVQQSSDVIVLLDAEGRIVYMSPQSERVLGYRPGDLVGKNALEFILPDDLAKMDAALRRVAERKTLGIPTDFRFRHARGHWVDLEALGTNLLDHPGIRGLLVTIRDVTERNLVQEALREKTEELDRFFTVALDLLCIADLEGRFRRLNPQWEKVLGYPLHELEGRRFLELVHPDDQAATLAAVGELSSQNAVLNFVNRYRCRDGSYRWIEWRSYPAGGLIFAAARDITERRREEQRILSLNALKEELLMPQTLEEKLKSVTETLVQTLRADFARIWLVRPSDRCEAGCCHAPVVDGPHVCRDRGCCLHLVASSGRYTHMDGESHRRVPLGSYKIGRVATGEDIGFVTNDVQHDPRVHNHAWAKELGLVAFAGYRLSSAEGKPVGVLALFSQQALSPEEVVFLEMLAKTTSQVIQAHAVEEALRQSGERYRNFVANASEGIFRIDLVPPVSVDLPRERLEMEIAQHAVIAEVNAALARMYGLRPEQMVGRPVRDFAPNCGSQMADLVHTKDYRITEREETEYSAEGAPIHIVESYTGTVENGKLTRVWGMQLNVTERKKAAEALRESMQRLQTVVTGAPIVLYSFDRHGVFTLSEGRGLTGLGLRPGQIVGQTVFEVYGDQPKAIAALRRALAGETFTEELSFPAGGTFEASHIALRDEAGAYNGTIGVLVDITERKRVEEALRESEERFRSLVESSPDWVWGIDPNGVYNYASPRCRDLLGYEPSEILGRSPLDFMPAEEVERVKSEFVSTFQAHHPLVQFENTNRHKDGRLVVLETNGVPVFDASGAFRGYRGIDRDITERKRAEEAAASEHALLRAVIDLLPDGIYLKDPDSRFLIVNRALARRLGKESAAEVLGLRDEELFPPQAAADYRADELAVLAGAEIREKEETVAFPNGEKLTILTTKVPFRNSQGAITGVLGTGHDITVRILAEQQIQKLNEELEQRVEERTAQLAAANKELEAFAYSVSHDLRAPLRSIDGFTRILTEDYAGVLDAEGHRVCGVILNNTRRMGQLIDDLLTFSRFGRTEMQWRPIDMEALARTAFHELKTPEKRGPIDIRVGPMPAAVGDPNLLRQVWINLLSNAVKFTGKREQAVIEVGGESRGRESVYWVRDNGVGFDMQYTAKLFGVFERLHSQKEFEGTGVGLAIVQRVIHRHGGRVWAEAAVDRGATFSFSLPRKSVQSSAAD